MVLVRHLASPRVGNPRLGVHNFLDRRDRLRWSGWLAGATGGIQPNPYNQPGVLRDSAGVFHLLALAFLCHAPTERSVYRGSGRGNFNPCHNRPILARKAQCGRVDADCSGMERLHKLPLLGDLAGQSQLTFLFQTALAFNETIDSQGNL